MPTALATSRCVSASDSRRFLITFPIFVACLWRITDFA